MWNYYRQNDWLTTNQFTRSAIECVCLFEIMLELRRQSAVDNTCSAREEDNKDEEQGGSALIPWPGMKYACLKVIQAYCKVFEQQDLYDLIVRYDTQEKHLQINQCEVWKC